MRNYIIYKRLSRVSRSGENLGLDAQQSAIDNFFRHQEVGSYKILGSYEEIETGTKKKVRPQFNAAVEACLENNATLVISKLDRLSRDLGTVLRLQDSKVDFIALDMRDASPLTIHIFSAIAMWEAKSISTRTKAALQAKKEKGFKLGNPQNFTSEHRRLGARSVNRKKAARADAFALKMYPTISYLLNSKHYSVYQVAKELNATNYPTASGKVSVWDVTKVRHCLQRVEASVAQQHKGG